MTLGGGMEYEILRRKTKQNQKTTQKKQNQKSKSRRKKQQQKLITPKNCNVYDTYIYENV